MDTVTPKAILLVVSTLAGEAQTHNEAPQVIQCRDNMPRYCTAIFSPVCASRVTGTRATYDNACLACKDPDVTGFIDGECNS